MSWTRFFRRAQWDDERARELEAYLESETADNVARGMAPAEARSAAVRKLGNPTRIREEIYDSNSFGFLEGLWQDVRYAVRVLRKSPGFTAVAVLSLALGAGANTAVFSLVHGVLLRPLPYPDPTRLVRLGRNGQGDDASRTELAFWKDHSSTLASVAGSEGRKSRYFVTQSSREFVRVLAVSTDFFRTLGVAPAEGREFEPAETRPHGPHSVVITQELSRRAFGQASAVGRTVQLGDNTYTIAGVAPQGFWYPDHADVFLPLIIEGNNTDNGFNTDLMARLKPGIPLGKAGAEMSTLSQAFRRDHPDFYRYGGLSLLPYHEWLVGDVRLKLLLLLGAVGLLLLIACSNLASLLLARLESRQREIAVRRALGSSTGRLLRQFLVENTVLGAAGSLAGLLGAYLSLGWLLSLIPFRLPTSQPIRIDLPVLLFTLAVAVATSLFFSLAPLLASARNDLQVALKGVGRSTGGGSLRRRVRSVLVVGEVALTVTLLAGAALLVGSLYRIHQERLGFSPQGVLTFFTPPAQRYREGNDYWRFESAMLEKLNAIPGVRSASAINVLPLTDQNNFPVQRQGHIEDSIGGMEIRIVSPGYFETMGIPIRHGRTLGLRDAETAPPVVVVSEAVARAWWPKGDPLGDHLLVGWFRGRNALGGEDAPREVVGVAADTKTVSRKAPPRPTIYLATAQTPWYADGTNWVVRGNSLATLPAQVRAAIAEIFPRQPVERMGTMDEIVSATSRDSRFDAWLFGGFAVLALLLSAIGIYGLLSFSVARRTNEIGTRMALGATRGNVLRMVLKQGTALIVVGLTVGIGGALLLTRSLESLLFGVRPTDPLSFIAVALLMLAAGMLASYIPARRATKVDPMRALRYE